MLLKCKNKKFFKLLFAVSGAALAGSFLLELGLHRPPCALCWVQRGVYLLLAPVALLGIMTAFKKPIWICSLILLGVGGAVSGYHTFVQLGFVKDRCKSEIAIDNQASFKRMLEDPQQGCSEVELKIGPIPLSALNGALSMGLMGLGLRIRV